MFGRAASRVFARVRSAFQSPWKRAGVAAGLGSLASMALSRFTSGRVCAHEQGRMQSNVEEPTVVFSCNAMNCIADQVCTGENSKCFQRGSVSWAHFADGSPNIFVNDIKQTVWGKHVVFIASLSDPSDIFNQLAVMYAFCRNHPKSFEIVLPFFPHGTMERVSREGEIATADIAAWMFDNLPNAPGGPVPIVIYDIHALQERFYFRNAVVPVLVSGVPLFKEELLKSHSHDKIAIAFPDDGAAKRFAKMFPEYPIIICGKRRDGDKRSISIEEGNPTGHHVFIVDDLVQSGGTIRECQAALEKAGAQAVSAYVTHGVFPKDSYKSFLPVDGRKNLKHFYLTDSCPAARQIDGQGPFKVIPLAPSIARHLLEFRSVNGFSPSTSNNPP